MRIVVDSNIVFSAILNSQGKIGQLVINGSKHFQIYTPALLEEEIKTHKNKIIKISGFSNKQFENIYKTLTGRINFVEEVIISDKYLFEAIDLVKDIDENNILFVALTNHINAQLWTGDKKLSKGLKRKGYSKIISTNELYERFLAKQSLFKGRIK